MAVKCEGQMATGERSNEWSCVPSNMQRAPGPFKPIGSCCILVTDGCPSFHLITVDDAPGF